MAPETYKRIMYLLTVPKCVCCGEPLEFTDRCLCSECREKYEKYKDRECSRCAKKIYTCSCSNKLLRADAIKKVFKVYRYRSWERDIPSNKLIYALKEQNRRDVFEFLAEELADSIKASFKLDPDKHIVTNIPRRQKSIMDFGYDHAAELAKRVAERLGIEYLPTMKSKAKKAQKESIGAERAKNAVFKIRKRSLPRIKGKSVIIVDDIITTGSSMIAAGKLLRSVGVRRTFSAAIAISYRDS